MIVTLLKPENVYSITLPEKVNGRYWISDIGPDGRRRNLISAEGVGGQWFLKETKKARLINSDESETILKPDTIYNVEIYDQSGESFLYAEVINDSRREYKKLVVTENIEITIGRDINNTIQVNNSFVSAHHAKLTYFDNIWTVIDEHSTNGTYVNDLRVSTMTLRPGDTVYIMGFKVIIGSNFIAMNNPDNTVTYDSSVLFSYAPQSIEENKNEITYQDIDDKYFYRSPRFKRDIEGPKIKVDPPPTVEKIDTTPMVLVVGPSVTMGMASASTAAFAIINATSSGNGMLTAMPTVVMSGSMLLGMIMWPILLKKYEKRKAAKKERLRQAKYKDYLFAIRDRIRKEMKEQSDILFENTLPQSNSVEWDRLMPEQIYIVLE